MPQLRATWRLQFRNGVDLAAASRLVPYLSRLGISHLYASPLMTARSDSSHGYDAVDPNAIEPGLGGRTGLDALAVELRRHGMGLLLDIVPNHLGADPGNRWWTGLLREGRRSPFAAFFDVDWAGVAGAGPDRVLLPILGDSYGAVLRSGELRLVHEGLPPTLWLAWHAHRIPIDPATLGDGADPEGIARDPDRLHALLEKQAWRLASWRAGSFALNWRRFFDVTELVSLRVEAADVFAASHALLLDLVRSGSVDAVRVDHVDGLASPEAYLVRLARTLETAAGRPVPILVEKILGEGEDLPGSWPVVGTTGYEALNLLNGLFVDPDGLPALDGIVATLPGAGPGAGPGASTFAAILAEAKQHILEHVLAGELERLALDLAGLARTELATRDLMPAALRRGLAAVLAGLDVYRLYHDAEGRLDAAGTARLDAAVERARAARAIDDPAVLAFVRRVLAGEIGSGRAIAIRAQQLSGPLMAKAMEDTAFYRWPLLLSANEVGGHADAPAVTVDSFHAANRTRLERHPLGLVATATHDTKRGEDTRLRIDVLSELATEWASLVRVVRVDLAPVRGRLAGGPAPSDDLLLAFLQTLVGVAPFTGLLEPSPELVERLVGWIRKAAREAKTRTSWLAPDDGYEAAVDAFVRKALDPAQAFDSLSRIDRFARRIMPVAAVHGLAQTLLKVTIPGVPDIYQGTERWDLALVDPDNRRPVDVAALADGLDLDASLPELLQSWTDGRIKQAVLARGLRLRALRPGLFATGAYVPLPVTGLHASRVVAFARVDAQKAVLVVVPRLVAPLMTNVAIPLPPAAAWGDTAVTLPHDLADEAFADVLGGVDSEMKSGPVLPLARLLAGLPVALLATAD